MIPTRLLISIKFLAIFFVVLICNSIQPLTPATLNLGIGDVRKGTYLTKGSFFWQNVDRVAKAHCENFYSKGSIDYLPTRDLSIGISIIFSLIFFIFSILDTIQYYSIQFKTEFLFHFSMN